MEDAELTRMQQAVMSGIRLLRISQGAPWPLLSPQEDTTKRLLPRSQETGLSRHGIFWGADPRFACLQNCEK